MAVPLFSYSENDGRGWYNVNIYGKREGGRMMADKKKKQTRAPNPEETLNDKQLAFCQEYIVDFNQTQSAVRAGYSEKTAGATASRLLRNVKVQQEIKRLIEERANRTGITGDMVVRQLAKIAFMDIKTVVNWQTAEIHERVGRDQITGEEIFTKVPITSLSLKNPDVVDGTLIQSVKMTKHGIAVEFPDRMRAFEMLAKHLGVYDDRPTATVNVDGFIEALKGTAGNQDLWAGFDNSAPTDRKQLNKEDGSKPGRSGDGDG